MKKYLVLLVALLVSSPLMAGDFYIRVGFMLNPNDFQSGKHKPIDNPLATIGGKWHITNMNHNDQKLSFYLEHSSGLFTGESAVGLNQLGFQLNF